MWVDHSNRHDYNIRSRSPMPTRGTPPTSPPSSNYSNFGGRRHGFNSGSSYGRTFGGLRPAIQLPPITTVFNAYEPLRSSPVRAAQTQTSDISAFGDNMVTRGAGPEDTDMATPDPSQGPSQHDGEMSGDRATTPQYSISSSNSDDSMPPTPDGPRRGPCITGHSCKRMPLSNMLNRFPASPPPGSQAQAGDASTIPDAGRSDTDHPMITPPSSSSAHSSIPTSSTSSISSDSTQRPPYNATEERCYLLNTLYHICMDATSTYLDNLPPATRNRHNQLPRHRCYGTTRYYPYVTPRSGRSAISSDDCYTRRRTLMDNISSISTHIWRRARSDEMAPHRAEGAAVHSMGELYKLSEIVVRGVESDGVDAEREDGPGEVLGLSVASAAEKLCRWLGDEQAWEDCECIERELKDLVKGETEGAGVRITEVDEESVDGNIT